MARSRTPTILALDEYAEFMSIPGWHFNQVSHPTRLTRGVCEETWHQDGYRYTDPNRVMGRDDVARAISTAEQKLADYLGFWPGPRWFCDERHQWPVPKRGTQHRLPYFHTDWKYLIGPGVETYTPVVLNEPITYVDTDGDGITDEARITYGLYLDYNPCAIAVVPVGEDPNEWDKRIRPLDVRIDTGTLYIDGPKWMFVDPANWMPTAEIPLDDDTYFLEAVDIYLHVNVASVTNAQIAWFPSECDSIICRETCQTACAQVVDERLGKFYAQPATYASGHWNRASWAGTTMPNQVRIWYYAGYRDLSCGCDTMPTSLKEAIVRLANCYLAEAPCGCGLTAERWEKDREEQDIDTFNVALARSAFGTTARGAVFALSVANSIPPIGQGG